MLTIIGAIVLVLLGLAFLPVLLEGAGIIVGVLAVVVLLAWLPTGDLQIAFLFAILPYGAFQCIRFAVALGRESRRRTLRAKGKIEHSPKTVQPPQPPRAG